MVVFLFFREIRTWDWSEWLPKTGTTQVNKRDFAMFYPISIRIFTIPMVVIHLFLRGPKGQTCHAGWAFSRWCTSIPRSRGQTVVLSSQPLTLQPTGTCGPIDNTADPGLYYIFALQ